MVPDMRASLSSMDALEIISVLDVRIHKITLDQLFSSILAFALSPEKQIIAHVNIKAINLAYHLPWYRDFLNKSDLVFCDGVGVALGAKILGHAIQLQHRMTCPDWIERLALVCEQNEVSMFLLAGRPGVAKNAIRKLLKIAPQLEVASHHGFFEKQGDENQRVIEQINRFNPGILYVGMGMPLQEKWIIENADKLNTRLIMPLGACLDFYVGEVARAPRWMTDHGFEWLGRLLIEPHRLWKRYLIGNPLFIWRVFKQRFGLLSFE